jgi:biopolymer transport protein ExbD
MTTVLAVAFAVVLAQDAPTTAPSATQPSGNSEAASQPAKLPPFHHMKIDIKNRKITLQTVVCLTEGQLELLVCKAQSKEHESILNTRATPSDLHAALLAMGLTAGVPARGVLTPDRTSMVFLPPQGAELTVRLQWKDAKGNVKEADASDWIEIANAKKGAPLPKNWVFVGSDITGAGTYWADDDGDIISVSNFGASVIDVPFESTNKNDEGLLYRAKKGAIPPVGTAVDVILSPVPGAEKAKHARVTIDVDRQGRCGLNGREIPADQLIAWGEKYIQDHAKGMVTLRVDGRALAYDIRRVQDELRMGGVFEVNPYILQPAVATLPRSEGQAQAALKEWDKKFQNPKEYILDPGEEATELLEQIQQQQEELKSLQGLHADYAQHLSAALKKYQATTKPAKDSPATDEKASKGENF